MASTSRRDRTTKVLKSVRPNAGLAAAYRQKLMALIEEMDRSVQFHLPAAYRQNEPRVAELAADESPANAMRAAIRRLATRWTKKFDDAAPRLAAWFSTKASDRSDAVLKKILRDAGISVEFKLTAAQQDILSATINQNVSLIKSIPSQYFSEIEGMVARSVQTGRDVGQLKKDLQARFGITSRRAANIALSQNNLATAALTRSRQMQIGITECIWQHSAGGREPRPTHVAASRDRVRYDPAVGWLDPAVGKRIWPGELPGCKCVARPVVKGFS